MARSIDGGWARAGPQCYPFGAQIQLSRSINKPARRRGRAARAAPAGLCHCPDSSSRGSTTLQISFSKVNFAQWNRLNWRVASLKVASTKPLQALPALMKKLVIQRVAKDVYLARQLTGRPYVFDLAIAIAMPDEQSGEVLYMDDQPRIESVEDLFLNPRASNLTLNISVRLSQRRVKDVVADFEQQVCVPQCNNIAADYRIIRIGLKPIRDEWRAEPVEKRYENRVDGVAYTQALLAWVDRSTGTVRFSRVHAYDFDEVCIGDVKETTRWSTVPFSNKNCYLGRLEQVQKKGQSKAQFLEKFKQLVDSGDNDDQQLGSGVPFLPMYCYNKYEPKEHGHGLEVWPLNDVDIAVSCINKYDAPGQLRDIHFPRDTRLVVVESDELQDVIAKVQKATNRAGDRDG
ncbi:hypothetical protein Slin15195_G063470 [Septoria linicola]|uniref:Uncharacterized protein n=1 Tax=Septoria linicola TaxID=215465 RepID=A0A9Q9EL39_9PEZI|nr:hypothetical protein Slin14017_G113780 [Septoria linicola]USW53028.1 hypothetical protein Slin15195_G063470 [Septoria linicola]